MELSILIPARNEIFTARTVADILEHSTAQTEIIVVLDGEWADPPIPQNERVTAVKLYESIGQRAATNLAARLARGKYVMKCDAHCAFAPGFDSVLLADMQDDWTVVPTMKNLHAFDWVCPCGHRTYQGAKRCQKCGNEDVTMDVVWIAKPSPNSTAYRFDNTLHFRYWGEYARRPEAQGDLSETMSLQGSCWMLTKDRYFELDICDENFGSWGQQGVEVACKTWLSGGRVMVNKKTWYAHMFRTQQGFTFPYEISGRQVEHARELSRDLFSNNKWPKATRKFSWLLEHFAPVPDWDGTSAGVLYYTDNQLDRALMERCQANLKKAVNDLRIVSVSLQKIDFGDNIHLTLERGYLTMFKQILTGLKELKTDVVFLAEHDVMYDPSHFKFRPAKRDVYYYNTNVWKVRQSDGHALYTDDCRQTSGLCAYRETLIKHYEERVKRTVAKFQELGDTREYRNWIRAQGFEPGTHHRNERVDDLTSETWQSEQPIYDIRHDGNLTPSRWRMDEFRNSRYTRGWKEGRYEAISDSRYVVVPAGNTVASTGGR